MITIIVREGRARPDIWEMTPHSTNAMATFHLSGDKGKHHYLIHSEMQRKIHPQVAKRLEMIF